MQNQKPLGVIDALSTGFAAVAKAVWVLAIPVLLDLFFWTGPKLSIASLVNRLVQLMPMPNLDAAEQQNLVQMMELVNSEAKRFNLFSLLAILVPNLMGVESVPAPARLMASDYAIDNPLTFIALASLFIVIGLLIGCAYLALIAQQVRADGDRLVPLPMRIGLYWVRVLALGLMLLIIAIAFMLPFSFVLGLVALASPPIAMFLMGGLWFIAVWISFYLFFTVDAIVIGEAGVARAIWNSVNVVHRNLWASLGLIVLINVISVGLNLIWRNLEVAAPWGALAGITGNAFVGSGLAAASLVFYQDRYARWQEARVAAQREAVMPRR